MTEAFDIFHCRLSLIIDPSSDTGKESSVFQEVLKNADTIDESQFHLEMDLTASIPEPTPIDKLGIKIVGEIKLGSTWNVTDSSAEIVRQLLSESKEAPDQCFSLDFDSIGGAFGNLTPGPPGDSSNHNDVAVTKQCVQQGASTNSEKRDNAICAGAQYKPEVWNERFQELLEYREKYENVLVPHNWSRNKPLAQWVKRQRYQYKLRCEGFHSTLTSERRSALNEIGFVWSSHNAAWEERFLKLVEFTGSHGHCNVPSNYQNTQLAVWVRCQRRQYTSFGRGTKPSTMTKERFQKLKSLGFNFSPRSLNV